MGSRVAKVRTNLIFCCGDAGGAEAEKSRLAPGLWRTVVWAVHCGTLEGAVLTYQPRNGCPEPAVPCAVS